MFVFISLALADHLQGQSGNELVTDNFSEDLYAGEFVSAKVESYVSCPTVPNLLDFDAADDDDGVERREESYSVYMEWDYCGAIPGLNPREDGITAVSFALGRQGQGKSTADPQNPFVQTGLGFYTSTGCSGGHSWVVDASPNTARADVDDDDDMEAQQDNRFNMVLSSTASKCYHFWKTEKEVHGTPTTGYRMSDYVYVYIGTVARVPLNRVRCIKVVCSSGSKNGASFLLVTLFFWFWKST
jgi:hypothetical protein